MDRGSATQPWIGESTFGITEARPLISPVVLEEEFPMSARAREVVAQARKGISDCLANRSNRLVVVVGPCSIHDPVAAFEFGSRLENRIARYRDKLCIIMRTYFEKPRSAVGWKGYLNDPDLNGSFQINKGLRNAKKLLNELNDIGVPCGCEFLNTQMPQFLATNISWVSIGARTTESQMHRELASGLAIPIGFKNTTDGNVEHAVKAVLAAREAHWFPSISSQGVSTVFHTTGNRNTHIVLRGGKVSGPNYGPDHVEKACSLLESVGLTPKLMVDCSHGNSGKDWRVQANVVASVIEQRKVNPSRIFGIMLESNLASGNQPFSQASNLVYGQSITDSCMGWEETDDVLARLATD